MSEHKDGAVIGYARVSTGKQDVALQLDALNEVGCARVFADTASGSLRIRPELDKCLDYLRAGDTLVVWKLDRLGRSHRHLLDTVAALGEHGIAFRSLRDPIDTSTAAGKLVLNLFAALAEFERDAARGISIVMFTPNLGVNDVNERRSEPSSGAVMFTLSTTVERHLSSG